jgi:hypothetical protein
VKFLSDQRLYSRTEDCLRFLRELGPGSQDLAPSAAERFHLYWSGAFGTKQAFCVKSFLATQDLARSELWLWLDGERGYDGHAENPILRPLLPFLEVRRFDPEVEAQDTPLERRLDLWKEAKNPTRRSNFVRHVVLYQRGGTYVDMDTMFLRDMAPLFEDSRFPDEFCYRWSVSVPYANSAILRLRQYGELARALLSKCDEYNSCRPRHVLRFDENEELDLTVLPCAFFDPLWLHRDGQDRYSAAPFHRFEDFFRPFGWGYRRKREVRSYRDFFPGAFTYHWHNCWDVEEPRNSYIGLFTREFDAILQKKLNIANPQA